MCVGTALVVFWGEGAWRVEDYWHSRSFICERPGDTHVGKMLGAECTCSEQQSQCRSHACDACSTEHEQGGVT